MTNIQLYNTLTRTKETFTPQNKNEVSLYTCGLTVYDYGHIGNFRAFIFYDVLRRTLEANGFNVKHVMNVTDVGHLTDDADYGEDKLEKGAAREGKTAWEVAAFFTQAYFEDAEKLNILPSTILCKATDHISEQIALVETLEQKGFTYKTSDGVYFDTSKLDDYGKLARLDIAGLEEGARVEKHPEKKNITDFALWKFSPEGSKRHMEWNSPWGIGFPGWHIECSAMAMKYLGETLDIHCGGIDHIPVHHTNEIAQSEAATGKPFSRVWMHSEFLLVNNEKMSKSKENFFTIADVEKKGFSPLAYRYFVLGGHYRSKLNFTWDALTAAQRAYDKIVAAVASWDEPTGRCSGLEERFMNAINDDLNTPQALAVLWELVKADVPSAEKIASLAAMDAVLGLSLIEHAKALREKIQNASANVHELLEKREKARAEKDYASADSIRDEITSMGLLVEDTDEGPIVKLNSTAHVA